MKRTRKIAALVLAGLLVVVGYLLYRTDKQAEKQSEKAPTSVGGQAPLVDDSALRTAQKVSQLVDKSEELGFAMEAIRLADHELDLAFAAAEREVKARPRVMSEKASEIEARLNKAQAIQKQEQAEVEQLTAAAAKASGSKKQAIDDRLDSVKAELELTDNEVDDATQDLVRAGGDAKSWLEQLAEEHKSTSESVDKAPPIKIVELPEKFGLIYRYQQWSALQRKKKQLQRAQGDATASAVAFSTKHNELKASIETAKQTSPDLAKHAKKNIAPGAPAPQKERSHEEAMAALASMKQVVAQQQDLVGLAKRAQYRKDLAALYGQWIAEVEARQSLVLNHAMQGILIILLITLAAMFFGSWLEKFVARLTMDRRQVQSLHTVVRVSLQIIGLLLILIVILGLPSQLGTFLGLAGAGLTVALKDFIVGFIGWFVLMGKNGIRMGDWVEINGVTGEVVQVGPFHTVLLETGNWTDSGHPTGRRVTFTNSFAIEGHYFNFSTSGQWLWDELQVVIPSDRDPNPLIVAIQKKVVEATKESADQAKEEWSKSTNSREMSSISVAPAISVKPVVGGVEVAVRYVTRANERYALRSKLYQEAVELLGSRPVETPPPPASPQGGAAQVVAQQNTEPPPPLNK
jgi:small-conductance mechanosensitive channel